MLDHLADFLQGALDRSRDSSATLGDELQVVESYLGIMQIRLGDRLRYAIDVPEEVRKIPFPPLLLQTLAENAITHGIQPGTDTGLLQISALRAGPQIILTISDDGVGIDRAASSGQGLGLKNATQRLESYYRGRASLTVAPGPVKGTTATVSIPASAP
jgi:sensor histidine kinase YesM